jgi:hypothetical protein
MKNIMIAGLPQEIHEDAARATLDIRVASPPDSSEIRIDSIKGRKSTVYDAVFAIAAGGTLEITENIKGRPTREVSLRGVLSSAAAMIPVEDKARLPQSIVDGPRILAGTVSFDPIRNRTLIDHLLGRESQAPAKALAEKAAADVIAGFRQAFRLNGLADQIHPGHL